MGRGCHAPPALPPSVRTAAFHGVARPPQPRHVHEAMAHTAGGALTALVAGPAGPACCAGKNYYGQLGDATTTNRNVPTAVSGSHTFKQIAAASFHTCGMRTDGTALCWGE